jgi:hypothetical protein
MVGMTSVYSYSGHSTQASCHPHVSSEALSNFSCPFHEAAHRTQRYCTH